MVGNFGCINHWTVYEKRERPAIRVYTVGRIMLRLCRTTPSGVHFLSSPNDAVIVGDGQFFSLQPPKSVISWEVFYSC